MADGGTWDFVAVFNGGDTLSYYANGVFKGDAVTPLNTPAE